MCREFDRIITIFDGIFKKRDIHHVSTIKQNASASFCIFIINNEMRSAIAINMYTLNII